MNNTYATDVEAARTAFDALSPTQKLLVTNLTDLVASEAGIVTTEGELTTAIATASKIFIVNNLTLTAPVEIDNKVLINGNGKTLTSPSSITGKSHNTSVVITANDVEVSNLIINANSSDVSQWVSPARFGMQVYDATGVKLTNVTLTTGQAGLLINSKNGDASVVAEGIHTSGNGFGGIEVYAVGGLTSTLTISNSTHSDASGKPAIWSEGAGTEVVNAPGYAKVDGDGTPPANGSVPTGKIYYNK